MLGENLKSASRSTFVETRGLLVSSENVIVMVSPSENPATTGTFGSAASTDLIDGPGFSPKFPVSNGEVSIDANDVISASLRSPLDRSVTVNTPTSGQLTAGSHEPLLTIVITRVAGSTKTPV